MSAFVYSRDQLVTIPFDIHNRVGFSYLDAKLCIFSELLTSFLGKIGFNPKTVSPPH